MYVKDYMTMSPITIGPDDSISSAMEVMSSNNIHRLPVVDKKNKLVGLLTGGVIRANTPNNSSTLSVFELNYLLNKLTVKDIMIKDVKTISGDDILEEAATVMLKNDVACLPVIDKDRVIRGIITHNDIFSAFVKLMGYHNKGTRYVINVAEDKPGILEAVARVFKENDASISNLAVYYTTRGIEVVVVAFGYADLTGELNKAGYNVTNTTKLN